MANYDSILLQTPIEYLKGVGPQKGDMLRKELQIAKYGDLIHHFPYRYVDKSKFTKIKDVPVDGSFTQCVARVIQTDILGEGFKKRLRAIVRDDSGETELVWFQGISWLQKTIVIGEVIIFYGKASVFNGAVSFSHPDIEKWIPGAKQLEKFEGLYHSTEKLKARFLNSKAIYSLIQNLLLQLKPSDIPEFLPKSILQKRNLPQRFESMHQIHAPTNAARQKHAANRFKYEELFLYQIQICKNKLNRRKIIGYIFDTVGDYFNTFYNEYLPFTLTDDQKKVIKEIRINTASGHQMNRLLQGDVGSGKTMVALLTMLLALDNGFQSCLIAPTEILSQQHYESISSLLAPMSIKVALLTGNIKGKARKLILQQLENGEIDFIIGTHALLEDKVVFKKLGLAIIDEQHRFGVAQRASIWRKSSTPPHILVMTATPIPRTLAMTLYGDLEVSTIQHLPPGRQAITTIHQYDSHRLKVMEFIKSEVNKGRQAYIVYPLIEESEKLDYENLMAGIEQVKLFFPEHSYKLSMVHGRQTQEDRAINMQRFVSGDTQIMIATTVIEVGVNVPNASVMLIESSERFGLSQLHQLRGRVGRGSEKSYCILLSGNKLSADGRERLSTMVQEINGFKISEKDLELRGPGNIYGTQQSGALPLKIADLIEDAAILTDARTDAMEILEADADLQLPENQALRNYVQKHFNHNIWSKIS